MSEEDELTEIIREFMEECLEDKPKQKQQSKPVEKDDIRDTRDSYYITKDSVVIYTVCSWCKKPIHSDTSQYCSSECKKKHLEDYTSRLKETVGIMEKKIEGME